LAKHFGYEQSARHILSTGLNKGKTLIQLIISIDGVKFDLDLRGTDDNLSLARDRDSRDFTINALYMSFDMEKDAATIDYPAYVSYS
jgi:hypothetical protein